MGKITWRWSLSCCSADIIDWGSGDLTRTGDVLDNGEGVAITGKFGGEPPRFLSSLNDRIASFAGRIVVSKGGLRRAAAAGEGASPSLPSFRLVSDNEFRCDFQRSRTFDSHGFHRVGSERSNRLGGLFEFESSKSGLGRCSRVFSRLSNSRSFVLSVSHLARNLGFEHNKKGFSLPP